MLPSTKKPQAACAWLDVCNHDSDNDTIDHAHTLIKGKEI
jgi:hypothetical protein